MNKLIAKFGEKVVSVSAPTGIMPATIQNFIIVDEDGIYCSASDTMHQPHNYGTKKNGNIMHVIYVDQDGFVSDNTEDKMVFLYNNRKEEFIFVLQPSDYDQEFIKFSSLVYTDDDTKTRKSANLFKYFFNRALLAINKELQLVDRVKFAEFLPMLIGQEITIVKEAKDKIGTDGTPKTNYYTRFNSSELSQQVDTEDDLIL